jgi:phosphatidylinositol phosphate synthase
MLAPSLGPLVTIFALWWIGLAVFAARTAIRGRPRTERVERAGGSPFLGTWFMEYGYWVVGLLARPFIRAGVSPNFVSLLGLAVVISASVAIGLGSFGLGGWLLCLGSILDAVDGMVARAHGTASDGGEFLDATVDRYAETASFIGLVYYYNEVWWALASVLGALLGSLMVSYVRAKAESLGLDPPGGPMRRHERAVYLGVGCAMAPVLAHFTERGAAHPNYHLALVATTLIAVFANYSALVTIHGCVRALRDRRRGP